MLRTQKTSPSMVGSIILMAAFVVQEQMVYTEQQKKEFYLAHSKEEDIVHGSPPLTWV